MKEKDIFKHPKITQEQQSDIEHMDDMHKQLSALVRECVDSDPNFWEDLYGPCPKVDYDKILKEYTYRKKYRRNKLMKVATVIIGLTMATILATTYIVKYPAVADKIKEIMSINFSDPSIKITKPDPNIGDPEFYSLYIEYTNPEKVGHAKNTYPDLYMPTYLPSGYKHVNLTIIDDSYNFNMVWEFVSRENDLLVIMQYGTNTPVVISAVLDEVERQKILDGLLP